MRTFIIIFISVAGTFFLLYILKRTQKKDKTDLKEKILKLTKIDEFKVLSKTPEFQNFIFSKPVINTGLSFGRDFILDTLGL